MAWILGFATMAGFYPWWQDPVTGPKTIALLVGLPLVLWQSRTTVTWAHVALLAWLGVTTITALWASNSGLAWAEVLAIGLLTMAFWIGQDSMDLAMSGAAWGLGLSSVLVLLHLLGHTPLPGSVQPAGLFSNKNFLGEASAMVLVWALWRQRWVLAILVLPSVALISTREAFLGLGLAGVAWLHGKRPWLGQLAFGIGFALACTWNSESLQLRFVWWGEALSHLAWLGHGPGSFWPLFPEFNHTYALSGSLLERPEYPHNELVGLAFGLGLWAIVPVAFLALLAFGRDKILLVVPAVACLLAFPLHVPGSLLLVGLLAGHCSGGLPGIGRPSRTWLSTLLPRLANADRGIGLGGA